MNIAHNYYSIIHLLELCRDYKIKNIFNSPQRPSIKQEKKIRKI